MMTEHLRKVIDRLVALPDDQQAAAAQIEIFLDENMSAEEQQRIVAQIADPQEVDLNHLLEEARREISAGDVYDLDEIAYHGGIPQTI